MHSLAGALGEALQMRLGHAHDVHAVHDAARQLKHLQGQAVMAVFLVLHHIAQPDQTGQQPVNGAFGKPGLPCQRLQADPGGVRRQMLDQLEDALHALYAAFFCHTTGLPMKFNKKFIISHGTQRLLCVPYYGTIITKFAAFFKLFSELRNP